MNSTMPIDRPTHGLQKSGAVASSLLAILLAYSMGSAQTPVRQPICDSEGFLDFAQKAEQLRVKRLLSEADFAKAAREENTVVLDARVLPP